MALVLTPINGRLPAHVLRVVDGGRGPRGPQRLRLDAADAYGHRRLPQALRPQPVDQRGRRLAHQDRRRPRPDRGRHQALGRVQVQALIAMPHHHPLREIGHTWWLIPAALAAITSAAIGGVLLH